MTDPLIEQILGYGEPGTTWTHGRQEVARLEARILADAERIAELEAALNVLCTSYGSLLEAYAEAAANTPHTQMRLSTCEGVLRGMRAFAGALRAAETGGA